MARDCCNARKAESDLNDLGVRIFFVPVEQEGETNPFYGWMRTGFRVFAELGQQYPRYRDVSVGRHAVEVFPHATAVALAGRHRPTEVGQVAWRRQVLVEQGYDVSGLRNADCVDAALAAVTAAYALRGSFSGFGNPAEGVIVTPHSDAAERFRVAQSLVLARGRRPHRDHAGL